MARGRKAKVFTLQEQKFIINNYKTLSFRSIGEKLNTSKDIVSVWCKTNGYILTEDERKLKQGNSLHYIPSFTKKQFQYIKQNYLKVSKGKMCKKFKCSYQKLDSALKYLGLTIPDEVIEQRKIDSRKSHYLGKGLSQEAYFGKEGVAKSLKYRFKKGNKEYLKQDRFQIKNKQ